VAKMKWLFTEGVTDLSSYRLGQLDERGRILRMLEAQQCFDFSSGLCGHVVCYEYAEVMKLIRESGDGR
jgi:hypothetical protein